MKTTVIGVGLLGATLALVTAFVACAPPPAGTCDAGQTMCADGCADLDTDPDDCGVCGNVCGDDEICATGTCRPRSTTPPDASSSADAASADAATEAASPDAAVLPTLDCAYYCSTVMGACSGAQAQYPSLASCLAFCAKLPAGALGDASGNTLGCRIGRAKLAGASPVTECANAGPSGGDTTAGGTAGACGDVCDALCTVGSSVCPAQTNECAAMLCPSYAASASYSTALTAGNTVGCRLFYLTKAVESTAAAGMYCTEVGAGSDLCVSN